jgi:hypothetical protein
MAGVLLRQAQRWREPLLRLTSLTTFDVPKHSAALVHSDLARVLGALNSLLHVPAHAPSITLRSFSTGRPLGLAEESKPKTHALSDDIAKTVSLTTLRLDRPPAPARLPPFLTLHPSLLQGGWSRDQVFNLPNGLSMARLLSGPVIAAWIIDGQVREQRPRPSFFAPFPH